MRLHVTLLRNRKAWRWQRVGRSEVNIRMKKPRGFLSLFFLRYPSVLQSTAPPVERQSELIKGLEGILKSLFHNGATISVAVACDAPHDIHDFCRGIGAKEDNFL